MCLFKVVSNCYFFVALKFQTCRKSQEFDRTAEEAVLTQQSLVAQQVHLSQIPRQWCPCRGGAIVEQLEQTHSIP